MNEQVRQLVFDLGALTCREKVAAAMPDCPEKYMLKESLSGKQKALIAALAAGGAGGLGYAGYENREALGGMVDGLKSRGNDFLSKLLHSSDAGGAGAGDGGAAAAGDDGAASRATQNAVAKQRMLAEALGLSGRSESIPYPSEVEDAPAPGNPAAIPHPAELEDAPVPRGAGQTSEADRVAAIRAGIGKSQSHANTGGDVGEMLRFRHALPAEPSISFK